MDNKQKNWESKVKEYLRVKWWDLSPQEIASLSKDFSLLLCVLGNDIPKYPRLAKEKNISAGTMFSSLVVCCKCSQSEEETNPLGTGMFLADLIAVNQILPNDIEIPFPKRLHIAHWRKVRDLSRYVDGETAAFVVERSNGIISGAKNFQNVLSASTNPYSEVTDKIRDSVAFLVVKGRKCFRLYSDGLMSYQVILVRKYGEWASRDLRSYFKQLDSVASSKGIDLGAFHVIFQASLMISERRLGAQFLIVNRKKIQHMIKSETRLESPKGIRNISEEELLRDVTRDGASIFTPSGELESIEAKFLATGGRLASVQDTTKLAPDALAIVVSQDGQVFVVDNGQVVNTLQK